MDVHGDSLTATYRNGNYLFTLDDGKKEVTTNMAQELYASGIQWFAPEADNYMPLIDLAENILESESYKHFTSEEILKFAEKDRWMIDYRSKGSGE